MRGIQLPLLKVQVQALVLLVLLTDAREQQETW